MKQSIKGVKEIKKEFFKQFYLSTHRGRLPKNIEWYFLPSDVTYEEMWNFIESTISQTRQEVIEELVEYTSHTKKCELLDRKDHKCICGLDDILEDLNKK